MQPHSNSPEEFRPVVGWEGCYEIGNRGSVRSMRSGSTTYVGKILAKQAGHPCLPGRLYPSVALSRNGRTTRHNIHRLIAEAFLSLPATPFHEVNHKNGDKSDYRLENLEWVTKSENGLHAAAMGLIGGEQHPKAKLTTADVRVIRGLRGQVSGPELARRFGVRRAIISKIQLRQRWRHV